MFMKCVTYKKAAHFWDILDIFCRYQPLKYHKIVTPMEARDICDKYFSWHMWQVSMLVLL